MTTTKPHPKPDDRDPVESHKKCPDCGRKIPLYRSPPTRNYPDGVLYSTMCPTMTANLRGLGRFIR